MAESDKEIIPIIFLPDVKNGWLWLCFQYWSWLHAKTKSDFIVEKKFSLKGFHHLLKIPSVFHNELRKGLIIWVAEKGRGVKDICCIS